MSNIFSLAGASDASCIMEEDATVEYLGCNTGNGCSGRIGMLTLAQQLLKKGGKVIAPSSYYAAMTYFNLTFTTSINGFNQQLDYYNSTDKWSLQGIWDKNSASISQICSVECKKLDDLYIKKEIETRNCSSSNPMMLELSNYRDHYRNVITKCANNPNLPTQDFVDALISSKDADPILKREYLITLTTVIDYYDYNFSNMSKCSNNSKSSTIFNILRTFIR